MAKREVYDPDEGECQRWRRMLSNGRIVKGGVGGDGKEGEDGEAQTDWT